MLLSYCTIFMLLWLHGYRDYHGNQVGKQYILSQGTYVPNMDLKYSHKAELLHSLLVAIVTVFP